MLSQAYQLQAKATEQQYQTKVLLLSYKNDQVMENDGLSVTANSKTKQ
jgi:hypothetical protein